MRLASSLAMFGLSSATCAAGSLSGGPQTRPRLVRCTPLRASLLALAASAAPLACGDPTEPRDAESKEDGCSATPSETCDAGAGGPDAGGTDAGLPITTVEASLPSWMVVVPGSIDGASPTPFLLDTGAERLALVPDTAAAIGGTTVAAFSFGERTYPDVPFVKHDLGLVSGLLGVDLTGNIGHEILRDRAVVIDYQRAAVFLPASWSDDLDLGASLAAPLEAQQLVLAKGYVAIAKARFENLAQDIVVVLDTGTNSAVISTTLFEALDIEEDGRTVLRGSSAVSGGDSVESDVVRIRSCAVGESTARRMWASVAPDYYFTFLSKQLDIDGKVDAILGGTYLREFLVAFDYPSSQLRLAPYATLDHVENEFRSAGIEVIRQDGVNRVYTVFQGSDAEAQGIAPGDALVTIDGAPAEALSLAEVTALLRGEPGTTLTMTLENGGGAYTVDVLREDLLPELSE